METVKHFEEVSVDVASYANKWTSKAKLSWWKTKIGRRRARRVGSGFAQSTLPTVEEEKASDAFLERTDVAELDEFKRRGIDGS
eukprot:1291292-Amphidinium_carterae.1